MLFWEEEVIHGRAIFEYTGDFCRSWKLYPCPKEETVVYLHDLEDWCFESLLIPAAVAMLFCMIQNKEAEYTRESEFLRKCAMWIQLQLPYNVNYFNVVVMIPSLQFGCEIWANNRYCDPFGDNLNQHHLWAMTSTGSKTRSVIIYWIETRYLWPNICWINIRKIDLYIYILQRKEHWCETFAHPSINIMGLWYAKHCPNPLGGLKDSSCSCGS